MGRLAVFAEEVLEFGFVFGLAAGARGVGQDARGLGLADALAGVGLDGFSGRESGWLAFGHGWNEYGMKQLSAFSFQLLALSCGREFRGAGVREYMDG